MQSVLNLTETKIMPISTCYTAQHGDYYMIKMTISKHGRTHSQSVMRWASFHAEQKGRHLWSLSMHQIRDGSILWSIN